MSWGSKNYCQQGKKLLFCTNLSQFVLSAKASVMCDIDHISVSVDSPVQPRLAAWSPTDSEMIGQSPTLISLRGCAKGQSLG